MALDKQDLAQLGKRAADMHLRHDIPLGEAVGKVAQATPNLTEHHVTRILNNANLITFEEKFKGGEDKHVVFDLADPVYVSREMDARSAAPDPIDDAYLSAPSYDSEEDHDAINFGFREKASSYMDQNHAFLASRELTTVRSAIQHVGADLNRADAAAEHELSKLAHMVRSVAQEMNNATAPLELLSYATSDEEVFEKVAHTLAGQMRDVPRGHAMNMAPNRDHPLCQQYFVVESLVKEASRLRDGLQNLHHKKNQVSSYIQQEKAHGRF